MNDLFALVLPFGAAFGLIFVMVLLVPFLDNIGGKISKSLGSPITRYWDWAERFIEKRGW